MDQRDKRSIFVIMPFSSTPKRNKIQLNAFFEDYLKTKIENSRFKYKYNVTRSDNTFNITEKIIIDIYNADVVICDLSGKNSNPNVMYELGMRLSLTDKPVILIREINEDNEGIFDISGFFAQPYDPLNYQPLIEHIKQKIKNIETGDEEYHSPVLSILKLNNPLLYELSYQRALEKLAILKFGLYDILMLLSLSLNEYFFEKKIELCITPTYTESNITFSSGSIINDFFDMVKNNSDKYDGIDLSSFNCSFKSLPMIDSFLSEQYLNNIVEAEIVGPFTLFLLSYHVHFLGLDLFHNKWTPGFVYIFFGETSILIQMIETVSTYMKTKIKEEKIEAKKKMLELKNSSYLYSKSKMV